jgi:hypothetical protein
MSGTSLGKYIVASLTLFADFSRRYAKKQSRRGNYGLPRRAFGSYCHSAILTAFP